MVMVMVGHPWNISNLDWDVEYIFTKKPTVEFWVFHLCLVVSVAILWIIKRGVVQDDLDLDAGFSCFGNMDCWATSLISYYKAYQVSVAGSKMATNEGSSTLEFSKKVVTKVWIFPWPKSHKVCIIDHIFAWTPTCPFKIICPRKGFGRIGYTNRAGQGIHSDFLDESIWVKDTEADGCLFK